MIRKDAISLIAKEIKNSPIVSANGFISRDLFETSEKSTNFYMLGSMGLASSIGLGLALKNKRKKIFIFDGDGNILMNLGSIATIGSIKPKNLIHVVFDNNAHESTGGQPTSSNNISIEKLAKSANYKIFKTSSKTNLLKILDTIKKISGPVMILVKVEKSKVTSTRVSIPTQLIKQRFMKSIKL